MNKGLFVFVKHIHTCILIKSASGCTCRPLVKESFKGVIAVGILRFGAGTLSRGMSRQQICLESSKSGFLSNFKEFGIDGAQGCSGEQFWLFVALPRLRA